MTQIPADVLTLVVVALLALMLFCGTLTAAVLYNVRSRNPMIAIDAAAGRHRRR